MKDKFLWIGLGIMIFWVVYSLHKWDMLSYGLWWFFIMIAPFSNLKRLHQEISCRYLYCPLIGLMLALSYLILEVIK
jgi:hypothetical protein